MLQVFKKLPVAREVWRLDTLPEGASAYRRDAITLGWEDRLKGRARRRSDAGVEFGTALARGTILRDGDCFVLAEESTIVIVSAQLEPVFIVEPRSPEEWGAFAYFIGNSHQPMMIAGGQIVCPDVSGMEQVLTYHAIPFSRSRRAFTPVGLMSDLALDHRHRPGQQPSEHR